MDKELVLQALADYFEIDMPDKEDGVYDWDYNWTSGCSFNRNSYLNLKNVVKALDYAGLLEDEEEEG